MHVRIPASDTLLDVARIVRYWLDPDLLEHDHRTAALHNTKEDIVRFGSFKLDVEPKSVAIKRQRSGDIFDYEQRRYSGDFWLRHLGVHHSLPQRSKSFLDRVSTGSGSDMVKSVIKLIKKYRMLITD